MLCPCVVMVLSVVYVCHVYVCHVLLLLLDPMLHASLVLAVQVCCHCPVTILLADLVSCVCHVTIVAVKLFVTRFAKKPEQFRIFENSDFSIMVFCISKAFFYSSIKSVISAAR